MAHSIPPCDSDARLMSAIAPIGSFEMLLPDHDGGKISVLLPFPSLLFPNVFFEGLSLPDRFVE